jgi:hypothetical protein
MALYSTAKLSATSRSTAFVPSDRSHSTRHNPARPRSRPRTPKQANTFSVRKRRLVGKMEHFHHTAERTPIHANAKKLDIYNIDKMRNRDRASRTASGQNNYSLNEKETAQTAKFGDRRTKPDQFKNTTSSVVKIARKGVYDRHEPNVVAEDEAR